MLKERLLTFINYLNISTRQFEILCKLSNGQINNTGDTLRKSSLEKIVKIYPELNTAWLQTGIGEMLLTTTAGKSSALMSQDAKNNRQGVPYYENIEGTCGLISLFSDHPEVPTFFINYEHFNDCTAYIPVVGDSMYPQYCSGEIIAIKRIFNLETILWGESYFIVTNDNANNLRTVKQVHWNEEPMKIILRASNPNYKGDMIIDKTDIISMFIIKGKIKRNQL